MDRRRGYLEPTILSVGAAKANFGLSSLGRFEKGSATTYQTLSRRPGEASISTLPKLGREKSSG
jgi:hypothetical protein